MSNETVTTVDISKLEATFDKKMSEKDSVIAKLQSELEAFKSSVAKTEIDKRDATIAELTASVETLTKEVVTHKTLVEDQGERIKANETKISELTEELKTKNDEVEKVTKELSDIQAKHVLASRISQYRDKSGDKETKDEDLAAKFGSLNDTAFATVLEFVKKQEVSEPDAAKLAQAAVAPASTQSNETPVVAPTNTAKPEDPIKSIAVRLFKDLFGETKTE